MLSLRLAFVVSLLLHIVFLIYLKSADSVEKKPKIISIDFHEKEPRIEKEPRKKQSRLNLISSAASPADFLKPKFNFSHTPYTRSHDGGHNLNDHFTEAPLTDNVDMAWGAGGGTFERVKYFLLYKKIYDSIDSVLFFPSFFVGKNLQGAVNARLVLNNVGTCNWNQTQIHESEFYIRLYVLSVLKKACQQNFKPYLNGRQLSVVDLSFLFQFGETENPQHDEENRFIVGNTLHFFRSKAKSIAEWEFGPFKGIFPLPAVYLDIPWIQENWDRIVNSKDPESIFKKEYGG